MNLSKLIKIIFLVGLIAAIINLDQVKTFLKPFIKEKKIKQINLEETEEDIEEEEEIEETNCNLNVNELQNFLDTQIDMVNTKAT
jgi:hypothetical protein